jgi:hypothetical protein
MNDLTFDQLEEYLRRLRTDDRISPERREEEVRHLEDVFRRAGWHLNITNPDDPLDKVRVEADDAQKALALAESLVNARATFRQAQDQRRGRILVTATFLEDLTVKFRAFIKGE